MLVLLLLLGIALVFCAFRHETPWMLLAGGTIFTFAAYAIDGEAQTEWRSKMEQQGCAPTQQRGKRVTAFTCSDGVTHFF